MSWINLPTNFKNQLWSGLKKYLKIDNVDGTVSFEDVTDYTYDTDTQMTASQLNQMTGAINQMMNGELFIGDAPADGSEYVRKNGDWAVSSGGGGSAAWGSISGSIANQTDLQTALNAKANTANLGDLAVKNTVNYNTEITNKPTLGSMAAIDDAPVNGSEYVRKDGTWAVSSGGGGGSGVWGAITGTITAQQDLMYLLEAYLQRSLVAGSFNPNTSYAVGDLCWRDDTHLYRFIVPHNGVWDSSHVEHTTVGLEIKRKINTADLGDLALKDTASWSTDITDKPTLGTMSAVDDAPNNGSEYVRKNGAWSVASDTPPAWGEITGTLSSQTDLQTALSAKANSADLGDLASKDSVDYSTEVTNKPTLGSLASKDSVDYSTEVTNKPTLGGLASKSSVDYSTEVTNKPTLGDLASKDSVDYETEVTNTPTLGSLASKSSVDYSTEVTNKPTLGSLASKSSVDYSTEVTNKPDLSVYATTALVQSNKPYVFTNTISAGSTATFNHTEITSTMRLINYFYSVPENVTSEVNWSTANGSITFTGTFAGATDITYMVAECN